MPIPYADPIDETQPTALGDLAQGDDKIRELKRALAQRMVDIVDGWPNGPLLLKVAVAYITTAMLADNAVTRVKMADASVGTAELVDAEVTGAKIAPLALTTGLYAALSVTDEKIAGMNGSKLVDGTVTAAKVVPGAFLTEVVDGSITNVKVADAVLEIAKLSAAAKALIAQTKKVVVATAASNQGSDTSTEVGVGAIVGAVVGDVVAIGFPNMDAWTAAQRTNGWYAFVSSAGQVKLRVLNSTSGNKDWPAASFTLSITKPISEW